MLEFRTIQLEDREWITQVLKKSDYRGCEYSFANNMAWRRLSGSQIARYKDFYLCCAMETADGIPSFCYPAGEGDHFDVIAQMRAFSASRHAPLFIWNVSDERLSWLAAHFPDEFVTEENRESWDYLYRAEDLAHLAGRKYHQKRNFLHRFVEYGAVWSDLSERDFDDCIAFAAVHYSDRMEGDHSAVSEQFAIDTYFRHFDTLQMQGGVLRVDGRIVAFTIGEPLSSDTFCVHIEKADTAFQGAYAAVNQGFARRILAQGFTFINREEDMGLPGLRKAKESYHPCMMQVKRSVLFKTI